VPVKYRRLQQVFAWKGMKTDVQQFVKNCQICMRAKPDRAAYPGKLQLLAIPSEAWKTISMDFIDNLPRSTNDNCILVVVEKFTRYAHFIPMSHPYTTASFFAGPYTTASVALVFMETIHRLHGMPASIISNRNRCSLASFGVHCSSKRV
jgi:hypothetical protein